MFLNILKSFLNVIKFETQYFHKLNCYNRAVEKRGAGGGASALYDFLEQKNFFQRKIGKH